MKAWYDIGHPLRLLAVAVLMLVGLTTGRVCAQEAVAGVDYKGAGVMEIQKAHVEAGTLPKMVFIQMYIFEIALEDSQDFGFVHQLQNSEGGTTGAELGDLRNPTGIDLGVLDPIAGGKELGFSLVGVAIDEDDGRIVSELQAFAQDRNTTVYASPYILTLDGEAAAVTTGDEVPYLERQLAGDDVVFTETFKPTGVEVKIIPIVVDDAMISLDVDLNVSSVSRMRNEQGFQQPIVQKSNYKSIHRLKSGTSIAVGGVLRRVDSTTETGVPYARDIPLLGRLFRGTQHERLLSELWIIVSPLIVDMNEGRNIMPNRELGGVRNELEDQASQLQQPGSSLEQIYDLLLEGPRVR